jgi:hypothetical protein
MSTCISSLRYPAWNAHAPYCHLWPVRLYNTFSYYYINGTIFEKKLLNLKKRVLIFFFETAPILRRTERDMIKNSYWSSCKVPGILFRILWNLNFLEELFEKKNSTIKFHKNPFSRRRAVHADGQKDRQAHGHDEDNSRCLLFCKRE